MAATAHHPLQYAPWTSDIELAFYSALATLKINHDKLDSSARKVLGLYEINHKDAPERSTRMQIHASALTSDEYVSNNKKRRFTDPDKHPVGRTPQGYYRAEGLIRNFNTIEEFRHVDKAAHVERAGRTIWDAIHDGTIYSCPSLLSSFSAICYADLKKYKFTYHFAYPCIHSDPQWKLLAPESRPEEGISKLGARETEELVGQVQTWRYSVDSRQHGFFLAKRVRKDLLEAQWRSSPGTGEIEEEKDDDGNMNMAAQKRRKSRTKSLGELGFLWSVGSLASYENDFFVNADAEDRFICFADPSTYPGNPGWMLRNLLVLVRQRWHLDKVQILCYRDTHARREHPTSLVLQLQSAEPVHGDDKAQQLSRDMPTMAKSSALRPNDVDAAGELIEHKDVPPAPAPEPLHEHPPRIPELPKITGWERNEQNKLVSRVVDLAAYMDPTRLADQAVDLNLKLIKWRISPSIDLETIKRTSCLLLGAGTLGSYVARGLMGWGVRKITFVDNAKVSFSNPVRQPLYDFKDCEDGGVRKAERAADVLSEIYPGMDANGYNLSVPMAGHPIIDEHRVKKEFEKLKYLIENHDAVFLLMDTRESRWLPTVMGKAAGKIVINAALGFDTYVVMRHGLKPDQPQARSALDDSPGARVPVQADDKKDPPKTSASDPIEPTPSGVKTEGEEELGCYFCSDVVAPADSLKSATLDQQCTVTRPGAAPLASSLAVELLVSILQHRLKARAPAPQPPTSGSANQIQPAPPTDPSLPGSHPLGTVPHQLRGYMSTWQTIQVKGKAYDCCAACSQKVVDAYQKDGWEFVKRAVTEKGYVEEISGLAEVQRRAEEMEKEIEEFDDDEEGLDAEGELV
ncbi:ubiquitin-like modifier-activating enzyme ATG7 [Teratosphaeria destructans]|uniref:Ubiquitin-like modifier-activating enzyme ATG7 n=1 Tax=Teratosphaeria destructans TaxID=418781 RepID=A0A9W7SLG4_9PEZI|nr:ubiquitin-like modifier-activating enzyme ATG7 [Teratosphaeria destructans]